MINEITNADQFIEMINNFGHPLLEAMVRGIVFAVLLCFSLKVFAHLGQEIWNDCLCEVFHARELSFREVLAIECALLVLAAPPYIAALLLSMTF
ncbi:MAG: hypothetical protein F9K32_09910 [Desulfobulbaceae bacterium]|nr:MAG: hypothetical protein F9K32_09910 [Desulfobulbaceae bacterium]